MKTRSFDPFSPGDADMSAYSDEQLVLEALDDSHQAFEQLVKQYQHRVLRTIASIISDEQAAQDVAQETFLSAWSDLAKLKEREKFGRWLNRIAINLSKDWLRDQRKHNENRFPLDENIAVLTQELSYQRDKLRQDVWEAIDELAEDHREAVTLYYISGYSYKEISQMLSVPISTVHGRLQQAKKQLRKEFLDMVTKLQLEIDSTVHKFLKEHAKQNGVSVEGLIIRLIERYKRDTDRPGIAVRKVDDEWSLWGGLSPDGRYASFRRRDGNLAVRDLTTGKTRDITDDGNRRGAGPKRFCGRFFAWSPDGVQIAYYWYNEGSYELRIIGLDGSKPRVLYRSEDTALGIAPFDWSQDGKFILGRRGLRGWREGDIVLVSLADGSVRTVRSLEGREFLGWPGGSLSPDGRYVTYNRTTEKIGEGSFDVFLSATDGSEEEVRLVGHTDSHDYRPVWTPDGKGIVFVCDRAPAGSTSLWLTRVADGKQMGEPQLVMKCAGYIYPLGFNREGSLYYGINSGLLRDIYVASLNMETGEVKSQPARLRCEGNNGHPVWSPDGKSLAYASFRHSTKMPQLMHPTLVIHSMETGQEREIYPEPLIGLYPRLRWSPDGRSILCGGRGGSQGLHLLDIQTGHVTTIDDIDNMADWVESRPWMTVNYPEWSRDGKTMFYIRRTGKEWNFFSIVARDLATGQERELYTGGYEWSCLRVSPDGQELVFSDEGQKALKVIPTAGGDPRILLNLHNRKNEEHDCVAPVTWTPDGRHLLFARWRFVSGEPYPPGKLWRIPVEGGEPGKVWESDEHLSLRELRSASFHPDGQRIAFARRHGESQHELWVMENLLTKFAADK